MLSDHGGEVILGNPNAHIDMKLDLTIILNPKKGSKCLTDEIFGPIWPMITYNNFDEVKSSLNESNNLYKYLSKKQVQEELNSFKNNEKDNSYQLWLILVLDKWLLRQ